MMQPAMILSSILHAMPRKPCNSEKLWQMPSSWPTTRNSTSSATATAPRIIVSILGTHHQAKPLAISIRSSTGIEPRRCFAAIIRTAIAFFPVGMPKWMLGYAELTQVRLGWPLAWFQCHRRNRNMPAVISNPEGLGAVVCAGVHGGRLPHEFLLRLRSAASPVPHARIW